MARRPARQALRNGDGKSLSLQPLNPSSWSSVRLLLQLRVAYEEWQLYSERRRTHSMLTARSFTLWHSFLLGVLALALLSLVSCGKKKSVDVLPPTPPNFTLALQYAQRAALAYEQDTTIQQQSGTGVRISISSPLSSGVKAYVEVNDAARVQWIVVRGTSSLINIRADVDYNKVVDSRLQIPLHKGFADAAL